jgi:hypothetical protein
VYLTIELDLAHTPRPHVPHSHVYTGPLFVVYKSCPEVRLLYLNCIRRSTWCVRDFDILNLYFFVLHDTDTFSSPLSSSRFLRYNTSSFQIESKSVVIHRSSSYHCHQSHPLRNVQGISHVRGFKKTKRIDTNSVTFFSPRHFLFLFFLQMDKHK